jgi:hypothetical protein
MNSVATLMTPHNTADIGPYRTLTMNSVTTLMTPHNTAGIGPYRTLTMNSVTTLMAPHNTAGIGLSPFPMKRWQGIWPTILTVVVADVGVHSLRCTPHTSPTSTLALALALALVVTLPGRGGVVATNRNCEPDLRQHHFRFLCTIKHRFIKHSILLLFRCEK